jgi:hypothetical protein
MDRATLWNTVEATEKRKDAQLAREVQVAIPDELLKDVREKLVWDFCQDNFVDMGMIVDVAIHGPTKENPRNWHWHGMLTMRSIGPDGFGLKERSWNENQHVERWKRNWETACNAALEQIGSSTRVDMRSIEERHAEQLRFAAEATNWIDKMRFEIEAARLDYTARPNLPQKAYRAAEKGEVYPGYEEATAAWTAAVESRGAARTKAMQMEAELEYLLGLTHHDGGDEISAEDKTINSWLTDRFEHDPAIVAIMANIADNNPGLLGSACEAQAFETFDQLGKNPEDPGHDQMAVLEGVGRRILDNGWKHLTHLEHTLRNHDGMWSINERSEPEERLSRDEDTGTGADVVSDADATKTPKEVVEVAPQAPDDRDAQVTSTADTAGYEPASGGEAREEAIGVPEGRSQGQDTPLPEQTASTPSQSAGERPEAPKGTRTTSQAKSSEDGGNARQGTTEPPAPPFLARAVSWFTEKSRAASEKAAQRSDKRKKSAWAKFIDSYRALADTWSDLHFAAHVNNRGPEEDEKVRPLRSTVRAAIRTVLRGQKQHPVDQLSYDQILEERAAIETTRGKINRHWISRAKNTNDPWETVDDTAMSPRDAALLEAEQSPKHETDRKKAANLKRIIAEQREREYQAEQARLKAEWDAGAPERLRRRREQYVDVALPLIQRARTDENFAYRLTKLSIDLDRPDEVIARDLVWSEPLPNRGDEYAWYVLQKEIEAADAEGARLLAAEEERLAPQDQKVEKAPEPKLQREQQKNSKRPSPSRRNDSFEP